MTSKEYYQAIIDLVDGSLEELIIEKEDFFTFRDAWLNHPNKKDILGEARHGGRVIYTKVSL